MEQLSITVGTSVYLSLPAKVKATAHLRRNIIYIVCLFNSHDKFKLYQTLNFVQLSLSQDIIL